MMMVGSDYEGDDGRPGPKPVLLQQRVFTAAEKLAELKREIAFRRRVYGNMVTTGAMRQIDAEFRIAVMEAIVADYRGPPPPQLNLEPPA